MLTRSGFGWNDTSSTIEVVDDQVWDEFVKSDSNARTMRYKACPYYKDWTLIFGKDRATGENAEAFVDAVNELVFQDKGKSAMSGSVGGDYVPMPNAETNDEFSDFMSTSHNNGATSSKGKTKMHKRPRNHVNGEIDGRLVDLMSKFFDKAESRLGELVQRIGFEHDASAMRKNVFQALSPMDGLTVENKITVAEVVCSSLKNLDIFFCLSVEDKSVMVKMILDGKF